jgi:hypothetical protein
MTTWKERVGLGCPLCEFTWHISNSGHWVSMEVPPPPTPSLLVCGDLSVFPWLGLEGSLSPPAE